MQNEIEQPNTEIDGAAIRPPLALVRPGLGPATETNGERVAISAPVVNQLPSLIASVAIFLVGTGLVAYYAPQLPHSGLVGLVLLGIMAIASERLSILVYGEAKVSVSYICLFAIAVLCIRQV
jgi:hypothetical protein